MPVPLPLPQNPPYDVEGGAVVEPDVEEPGSGDLDALDPVDLPEIPPQYLSYPHRGLPGGPRQLKGDVGGVIPTPTRPGHPYDGPLGHGNCQLPVINSTTHGVQDGTGELDGGHGTSVWEEGGGYANWFGDGSGIWTGTATSADRSPPDPPHPPACSAAGSADSGAVVRVC